MTYNNNFSINCTSKSISLAEKLLDFISFIFYAIKYVLKNEAVIMTCKVAFSLLCFVALISVTYFVSVGALGALSAIIISLVLLGAVAFTFSSENS